MIIKSFIAESAAAALKQVRHQMGGEAVVLKTRQISDAGPMMRVEVTALLDSPTVAQSENILEVRLDEVSNKNTDPPKEISPREYIRELLAENDFSKSYIDELALRAISLEDDLAGLVSSLTGALTDDLQARIIANLDFRHGDRVLIVGSVGSGKTSLLGKLAAHLILKEKKKVQLASLDQFRIGAGDEVRSYAALLGAEAVDPFSSQPPKSNSSEAVTLIEAPTLEVSSDKMNRLKEMALSWEVTHSLLTLSSLSRTADLPRLLKSAYEFDPQYLAVTQLDLTSRYGAFLSLLHDSSIKLAFLTDQPGGVGEVKLPVARELVSRMLTAEVDFD